MKKIHGLESRMDGALVGAGSISDNHGYMSEPGIWLFWELQSAKKGYPYLYPDGFGARSNTRPRHSVNCA
jgi:hypothetical protein